MRSGKKYIYSVSRYGEELFKGIVEDCCNFINDFGFDCTPWTIREYARRNHCMKGGFLVNKTDEVLENIYTIDYQGKEYTGTAAELHNLLGISQYKISCRHNSRLERLEREREEEMEEIARLQDVVDEIKEYVSMPPCYKTFYHKSDDDEAIKKMMGKEYKFESIVNKKEGWNYWEITYANN